MADKTWEFSATLVTEKAIRKMEKEGFFASSRAELLRVDQTMPMLKEGHAVVFQDYFTCGLAVTP